MHAYLVGSQPRPGGPGILAGSVHAGTHSDQVEEDWELVIGTPTRRRAGPRSRRA